MLEEEDDGGNGNERAEARDEVGVEYGRAHVIEARGNGLENENGVILDGVGAKVGPTGDSDEDDDEGRTKSVGEEGDAADDGVASAKLDALEDGSNDEEEDERSETESGILLRVGKVLERVDLCEKAVSAC